MNQKALQDYYPDEVSHCYGCGRLNPSGYQLKSYWDESETVAAYVPDAYHTAIPGYVYGGLIASLIDCHGTGSAAAAVARSAGDVASNALPRFVTAALEVSYLEPIPLGPPLDLRGTIAQQTERKVVVEVTVSVEGAVKARGRVIAVIMPEGMLRKT